MKIYFGAFVAGVALLGLFTLEAQGLSCFCGATPCEAPKCCDSGSYTLDACGCCPVCAKGADETCGGPFRTSGSCDVGLSCLKECSCKTENGLDCIFPFNFKGNTYNYCTDAESANNNTWCATEVDADGNVHIGKWDDCDFSCPSQGYGCDTTYFFNSVGRCANKTEVESVKTRSSVEVEEGLTEADLAPLCGAVQDVNFCRCSQELLSPLTGSKTGKPCEPMHGGRVPESNGWCFLDNIKDPGNATANCYEDTTWSETHGRFWFNLACKFDVIVEGRTSPQEEYDYDDEFQIFFEE
uniref:Cysteine-rich motor neuron 1 protein n=1 Tax=Caligus clemensi TaxID=344056 RepID=C1C283_CALCM|nr:Cysteine-rich motor neuron 1 protein precursor [Caligus clemensi]